ncbi:MAG: hypothetical protein J6L88_03230, partial [Clostridia bacterium]|nr:hypothetical protein [Clostridia bacterium]
MKHLKNHIKAAMTFLLVLFIVLTGFFVYSIYTDGTRWYNSSNNTRLQADTDHVIMGDVTDRNGNLIAWSNAPNSRSYTDNNALRYSMAHLLGDDIGMTSADLQSRFARILYGDERGFISKLIETVEQENIHGENIMLTIDQNVQMTAYDALYGREGAVVVMNYQTGEVIANVSLPTFDPASVTYEEALQAPNGTFVNKVTQGLYPPGSIFKIITAASAIENDGMYATYTCDGVNQIENTAVRVACFHNNVHGDLDLTGAFTRSCNGAFADWGVHICGADSLYSTAEKFGFNDNFLFGDCTLYNSSFVMPETDYDLAWASVGQGKTMISPLHAVMIASSVANEGVMMEPRYLYAVSDVNGVVQMESSAQYRRTMDSSTANVIE